MLEFVIKNYLLFIILAIILLLGLIGYIVDRKKYEKYREEIMNEGRAIESLEKQPLIDIVAPSIAANVSNIPSEPEEKK